MEQTTPTTTERALALFCHLSPAVTLWFIGPLVVYATAGKRSKFVARHAAMALVIQLRVLIGVVLVGLVGWLLFSYVWTEVAPGNLGLGRAPEAFMVAVLGLGPLALLYLLATAVAAVQSLVGKHASGPLARLLDQFASARL